MVLVVLAVLKSR